MIGLKQESLRTLFRLWSKAGRAVSHVTVPGRIGPNWRHATTSTTRSHGSSPSLCTTLADVTCVSVHCTWRTSLFLSWSEHNSCHNNLQTISQSHFAFQIEILLGVVIWLHLATPLIPDHNNNTCAQCISHQVPILDFLMRFNKSNCRLKNRAGLFVNRTAHKTEY